MWASVVMAFIFVSNHLYLFVMAFFTYFYFQINNFLWEHVKPLLQLFVQILRVGSTVKDLTREFDILEMKLKDVQEVIKMDEASMKKPTEEVVGWMKRVEALQPSVKSIITDYASQRYLRSIYSIGRQAVNKLKEVRQEAESIKSVRAYTITAPPPMVQEVPTATLAAPCVKNRECQSVHDVDSYAEAVTFIFVEAFVFVWKHFYPVVMVVMAVMALLTLFFFKNFLKEHVTPLIQILRIRSTVKDLTREFDILEMKLKDVQEVIKMDEASMKKPTAEVKGWMKRVEALQPSVESIITDSASQRYLRSIWSIGRQAVNKLKEVRQEAESIKSVRAYTIAAPPPMVHEVPTATLATPCGKNRECQSVHYSCSSARFAMAVIFVMAYIFVLAFFFDLHLYPLVMAFICDLHLYPVVMVVMALLTFFFKNFSWEHVEIFATGWAVVMTCISALIDPYPFFITMIICVFFMNFLRQLVKIKLKAPTTAATLPSVQLMSVAPHDSGDFIDDSSQPIKEVPEATIAEGGNLVGGYVQG